MVARGKPRRKPPAKLWEVYAADFDVGSLGYISRGPLWYTSRGHPKYYYLKKFYNQEAAEQQAIWCSESWPDVRVDVCVRNREDNTTISMPVWVLVPHLHPELPCGCKRSLPPCSLEHAVRISADHT